MKHLLENLLWLFVLITAISFSALGQNSSPCQPPDIAVAAYNFVPESPLQTGDFRPLMKTESAFLESVREVPNINLSDYTTQILPADIQPELPPITENFQPPPSQIQDTYFFTGQITKTGSGFLLSVQLKKSADGTILNEVKTSFVKVSEAETAGKTNAAAMILFFQTKN